MCVENLCLAVPLDTGRSRIPTGYISGRIQGVNGTVFDAVQQQAQQLLTVGQVPPGPFPCWRGFSCNAASARNRGASSCCWERTEGQIPPKPMVVLENDIVWRFSSGIKVCLCTTTIRFEKLPLFPADEKTTDFSKETQSQRNRSIVN
jgi:hypothetical protein